MSHLEALLPNIWQQVLDQIIQFDHNQICGPNGDITSPLHQLGGLNFASKTTQYRVRAYLSRKFDDRKLNILRLLARDITKESRLAFAVAIGSLLIENPFRPWIRTLPVNYAIELTFILADAFDDWKAACSRIVGPVGTRRQSRAFKALMDGAEPIVAAKCRIMGDHVPASWFSSLSWKELEAELNSKQLEWIADILMRRRKVKRVVFRVMRPEETPQ
ncbi:hypothetical protein N7466_006182 [Penicillium verhagenii]|uniref:uncharacterized protein n=1 Tax=Penicillium verhagenii TaxID=1562060 RepID=UPI0025451A62|nr:uncharacterized protein N7466_006182 [Penicillium verhagenii]KAJ5930689.1 hypothetical protein N7466_006182 [Penicillium verhagenii]